MQLGLKRPKKLVQCYTLALLHYITLQKICAKYKNVYKNVLRRNTSFIKNALLNNYVFKNACNLSLNNVLLVPHNNFFFYFLLFYVPCVRFHGNNNNYWRRR